MTCIVAIRKDGKVVIGGDRLVSFPNNKLIDNMHEGSYSKLTPKIFRRNNLYAGFAGPLVFQEAMELISSLLETHHFYDIMEKARAIMVAFNVNGDIIITDKKEMGMIKYMDNKYHCMYSTTHLNTIYALDNCHKVYNDKHKNIELLSIGTSSELVFGSVRASAKSTVKGMVFEAIEGASIFFPFSVGKPKDFFE